MFSLKFTRREYFSLNHWVSIPFAINTSCDKKKSRASFSYLTVPKVFFHLGGIKFVSYWIINMVLNFQSGKQCDFPTCKSKPEKTPPPNSPLLPPKQSLWHVKEYCHLLHPQGNTDFPEIKPCVSNHVPNNKSQTSFYYNEFPINLKSFKSKIISIYYQFLI